ENFIITAGRLWDQAKNIAILEKAAGAIRWPILAAGDAENPNGGVAEFKNLHLLGQLSDMEIADRLARASIFALPARYEPFGLCALEAALAGCALVLGDIPSLRERSEERRVGKECRSRCARRRGIAAGPSEC